MSDSVLVVLVNGDAVFAYPLAKNDINLIGIIRDRVQKRVEEHNTPRPRFEEDMLKVRLQVVQVDMPGCSPDGFIASLVNDIMDKVST